MRKLKILYAGSPLASSFVLKKLIKLTNSANIEICGVLTNPPSSKGRHKELVPTECAQVAAENNIPVFEFSTLKTEAREAISPLKCDLLVCFDFGKIFGPKFLELFPLGGINFHPSALPKYRGCTPIPQALLNGDRSIGLSVQKLALKTDEGDILAFEHMGLFGYETTEFLMDGIPDSDGKRTDSPVTNSGYILLEQVLLSTAKNYDEKTDSFILPEATPQSGEASYTPFIKKEDGEINWKDSSTIIDRKLRAFTSWPGIYTFKGETSLKILKGKPLPFAEYKNLVIPEDATEGTVLPYRKNIGIEILCGKNSETSGDNPTVFVATELQWQGKKVMDYKSFLNGSRDFIGCVLGKNI